MISISLTSGMFPRSFLSASPNSLDASTSGTSSSGSLHAAFPAEDLMPKDATVDRIRIFTRLHDKFIESWRSGEQYLRVLPKLLNSIVSFGQVLPRQLR